MTHMYVLPFGVLLLAASASRAEPGFDKNVKPFLAAHCLGCHGPSTQKAGLRLDTLAFDLTSRETLARWIKVFDKTASGAMPPARRRRPPPTESKAMTAWLEQALHSASLTSQQQHGRVDLRRLNRIEYENTLRDLLGVHTSVQDLLPDDGSANGFDNVAAALDVSPAHLVRYLQAADRALGVALQRRKSDMIHQRIVAGPAAAQRFKGSLNKDLLIEGDSFIYFTNRPGHQRLGTIQTKVPGTYRLKLCCSAVNSDKPLVVAVHKRFYTHFIPDRLPMYFDVAPGQPRVYEFALRLERAESFSWSVPGLPGDEAFKKLRGDRSLTDLRAPGLRVDWFEFEGPLGDTTWPPLSHRLLFDDLPLETASASKALRSGRKPDRSNRQDEPYEAWSDHPREDAERLLRRFARRAFRRSVGDREVAPFVAMVHARLEQGYSFAEAMRVGFKAILCAPEFLFLLEKPGRLGDSALASRLAYFLWSTTPDEELLRCAEKGELHKPAVLRAQVERLLKDPKAHAFTDNFLGQWLDLRQLEATNPDSILYPEFDEALLWAMQRETELFFTHVLQHDRPLLDFVHSDYLFLNQRLAEHYGIEGVHGAAFRRVANPPGSHRGGVLTQASVLKVSANGTVTSPVVRGKFVLERILGTPPEPPPPDIPAIEPDIRGATSVREQLAKHRQLEACAGCHVHIDPPGFALENFDAIGGWRTFYRASASTKRGWVVLPGQRKVWKGLDVEAGDVTPDGQRFRDIDGYQQILLKDREQIARNLTEKLLTYATGAAPQFADRAEIEAIVNRVRGKQYGFRTLIHEIVQNRVFLSK